MGSPADRIAFGHRPKLIHAGCLGPGNLKFPVPTASAKKKLVVFDRFVPVKDHFLQPCVHTLNGDPGAKLSADVSVPLRGLDEPAAEAFFAAQVGLGKGWPPEGNTGLVSQHHDAAAPALLAEGHGGISTGQAGASDNGRLVCGQAITIPLRGLVQVERALIDEGCRVGDRLQAFDWDGLAGDFAEAIGALIDTLERSLYLREFFPI